MPDVSFMRALKVHRQAWGMVDIDIRDKEEVASALAIILGEHSETAPYRTIFTNGYAQRQLNLSSLTIEHETIDLLDGEVNGLDMRGSQASHTCWRNGKIYRGLFNNADLSFTKFEGMVLSYCDFTDADLNAFDHINTTIWAPTGLLVVYAPGMSGRDDYLYAVDHRPSKGTIMIKAGCFWGNIDQFEGRVKGQRDLYEATLPLIKLTFPLTQR